MADRFLYDCSSDPWGTELPREMAPFDVGPNDQIARGVERVCVGEVNQLLIPISVTAAPGGLAGQDNARRYYIAAVRVSLDEVILVQCRLDYTNRVLKILQRPVHAMQAFVCRFRYFKFTTSMLVPELVDLLFWRAIRQEWSARVDGIVLSHPRFPLDANLSAYYRKKAGGLGDFSQWTLSGTAFHRLPAARLSVLLQAAVSSGSSGAFASLLPLGRTGVDGWKLFPSIVVMRAARCSDVAVVFIDFGPSHTVSQHAVCFGNLGGVIPHGVAVGSASLNKECIQLLFHEALHAHWSGPAVMARIPSLDRVVSPAASAVGGFQLHGMTLSPDSERLVVAGLSLVCSSGGLEKMLVPVTASAPAGATDAAYFVAIVRRIRAVGLSFVYLEPSGVAKLVPFQGLPRDLIGVSPFMDGIILTGVRPTDHGDVASMFFDTVFTVWSRRFISLAFVQKVNMLDGIRGYVKGFHLHPPATVPVGNPLVRFPGFMDRFIELAIKICITDSNCDELLMPNITDRKEMIAVVRVLESERRNKFLVLHLMVDGISPMAVKAIDCSGFASSPIDYVVHGVPLEVSDLRRLFDRVVFEHWKEISRVNPFNWSERRLAFALCTVPRLATASVLRLLDPSIVGMIGVLVV